MGPNDRDRWKSDLLDQVFEALAHSADLSRWLVFKGARVLRRRVATIHRQSLDIDSNLTAAFPAQGDLKEQAAVLQGAIERAVVRQFENHNPVRFRLQSCRVSPRPPRGHPRGWTAFEVRLNVSDGTLPGVLGLPALDIDIASPETVGRDAIAPLSIGSAVVQAYTTERIAGEKLRAFLSSLPAYRKKVHKPGEAVRAKDLYDLTHIFRFKPLPENAAFWRAAGAEFALACESRSIDCAGWDTFAQDWPVTKKTFEETAVFERDVTIDDAEQVLQQIVEFFKSTKIIPFTHPLVD